MTPAYGFGFDLMLRLGALYRFKSYTDSIWVAVEEGANSLLSAGLAMDFAWHLVNQMTRSFVIVEKDLCGEMPMPYYPNCPETGLGGIIHCIFSTYDKAHDDAPAEFKTKLAENMYKAADQLFMPAISAYLNYWIFHTQQGSSALNFNNALMPFGEPLLVDQAIPQATNKDGSPSQAYDYHYKRLACAYIIREYYRLATLDARIGSTKCFTVRDHLSQALANTLAGTEISHSVGINLDFMLEAHLRLEKNAMRPRQLAHRVSKATMEALRNFANLTRRLGEGMAEAHSAANEILKDQMAQKAKTSRIPNPPAFYLQEIIPVLPLVQAFAVLNLLKKGAKELEECMPCIRIAITLYKMMQRILPAAQTKDIA
jgi:hypothetical protein